MRSGVIILRGASVGKERGGGNPGGDDEVVRVRRVGCGDTELVDSLAGDTRGLAGDTPGRGPPVLVRILYALREESKEHFKGTRSSY